MFSTQRCVTLLFNFADPSRDEQKDTKHFVCFDVSPNNRLLVCGTELYDGDAFLLFWDIRKTKLLGGYWESHTDDITEVTTFAFNATIKAISISFCDIFNILVVAPTGVCST